VSRSGSGLLSLFPDFDAVGGVQTSGRLAWEALRELPESYAFTFGRRLSRGGPEDGAVCIHASSKPGAVLAALRRRWPVSTVLVWHLSLLKLTPFLRVPEARVVQVLHGIEAWRVQPHLTRRLLRGVDTFICMSDHTWRCFVDANLEFRDAPHVTMQLGIGAPILGELLPPASPPAALMLGRLARTEDYKGHRELIAAWPYVLQSIPDAELCIVGDGDLRSELEDVATQLGLQGHVRFWGLVSESVKEALLMRARCLALPSRGEGFGLAYLEAMRLGRPCLVSGLDAGSEVVAPPSCGLAADPGNAAALVDAVCRLLTIDETWTAWSRRARQRYEAHFTAHHFRDRLLAALGRETPPAAAPLGWTGH
jgi:phosphatidylinositol alpha-1,6-mannosyltransferase